MERFDCIYIYTNCTKIENFLKKFFKFCTICISALHVYVSSTPEIL